MELYYFPLSTTSQKVRLCQLHKGIELAERVVDLGKLEQLEPSYLALNPNGEVPTLVVDGRTVTESSIINEYLEERFPEAPLLPKDPYGRACVRMWTKYVDAGPTVAIQSPTFNAFLRPMLLGRPPGELADRIARIPVPATRERWRRMVAGAIGEAEMASAYATVAEMLARMETMLGDRPWLVGQAYSLADVETTPVVLRALHLGRADLWAQRPRVSAWLERVQALPNFAQTYAFLSEKAG